MNPPALGVIKRHRVKSSNLYALGYDDDSDTVETEFSSGAIWQYWPIRKSTLDNVIAASSVGSAFNKQIRDVAENSRQVA